jgi:MFS family permease
MPVLAVDLHAIRDYGFAFSIFLTASLLGIVVSGGWCDARGPIWPVRIGLVMFGAGVLLCGLAPTFTVLLAARALAGAGAGLLIVAIYVVIADVFPSALQPRVFSLLSAGWVLPGILGPVLAGWLAENVSWRAVFLLVAPLIIPPALALLPRLRPDASLPVGPAGSAGLAETIGPARAVGPVRSGPAANRVGPRIVAGCALAAGVLALQWGLGGLGRYSGAALAAAAVALGAGLLLVILGFGRLVPAGTLTLRRGLPTVITLRGLYAGTFFGVESFIPLMLVTERGLTATEAGLVLTGATLGWTAGSFLQARPSLRLPRHLLLVIGAAIIGVSQWALVLAVRPPVPAWVAMPIWALTALGMGIAMSSTSVLVLRLSEAGLEGRNSAALQLSDSLGGALGIGLTGAAFAAWHHPGGSDAVLFTGIWLAAGTISLFAAMIGFRARSVPQPA